MSDKILKLDQAQTLYQDLRGRIDALPTSSDIPEVPVQDVQINGASVLQDGVANIPKGSANEYGVFRLISGTQAGLAVGSSTGNLYIKCADISEIKRVYSGDSQKPIVPTNQHAAVFYGLATASGDTTQKNSSNSIGQYTPEAKGAIQSMLGVSDLIATEENNLVASKAYSIGDVFTANGKLYKATAAIAADAAIIPVVEGEEITGANCEETSVGEGFVKKTDYATSSKVGVVRIGNGLYMSGEMLHINTAPDNLIKAGSNSYAPITPSNQSKATFYGLAKAAGDTTQSVSDNAVGTYTDQAKAAIRTMLGAVGDVQVNGTSVITNNVANIPIATQTTFGVTKGYGSAGINIDASGNVSLAVADTSKVKAGTSNGSAISPSRQHEAVFYGLAKASGDTTQSTSSNAVGTYTDNAKASIKAMLGIQDGSTGTVDVSGTDPVIAAVENTRYVCGEVTSLNFTPPASGISIVRFTSGSTVTVLTIPSTVKFPEWFDPTSLETNTIYEICVTDGEFGAVMSWPL